MFTKLELCSLELVDDEMDDVGPHRTISNQFERFRRTRVKTENTIYLLILLRNKEPIQYGNSFRNSVNQNYQLQLQIRLKYSPQNSF